MQGLKDANNYIFVFGETVQFGIWDEPDFEKWAILDKDNNPILYAVDNNFTVVEFNEEDIPEDYSTYKYFFIDGAFVLDTNYIDPPLPTEARVEMLEADMDMMSDYSLELLYQISLLQLGMDESDVEE